MMRMRIGTECWAGEAGPHWRHRHSWQQWGHWLSLLPRSSYTKASPIYPFLNYWMHPIPRLFVLVHLSGAAFRTPVLLCIKAAWNREESKFAQLLKGSLQVMSMKFPSDFALRRWGEAGGRGRCPSLGTLSPSHPRQVHPCQRHNSLQCALSPHLPQLSCTRNCESQLQTELNVSGNSACAGKSHKMGIFHWDFYILLQLWLVGFTRQSWDFIHHTKIKPRGKKMLENRWQWLCLK